MATFDPTDEGRNRFLRHKHRTPLKKLMFDMFGQHAYPLLSNLKRLMDRPGSEEAFEQHVRAILRHCGRLTGSNIEQRKLAYVRACIDDLEDLHKEHSDDEIVKRQANPKVLLTSCKGIDRKLADRICGDLTSAMIWRLKTRAYRDDDGTMLGQRAADIVRKAAKMCRPLRYLRIVIMNETLACKKHEGARR